MKNWIPKVLQSAVTFVSSDITKGNAWFESLSTELKNSDYAILCLTPDNIKSPWLNFEAGALFDRFNSSKVCPFLFNIQPSDIDGPLKQLQAAVFTKEDIFKLISSLNDLMETKIDNERFKDVFEKHWPELKQSFDNIHVKQTQPVKNKKSSSTSNSNTLLEKILPSLSAKSKQAEAAEILWERFLEVRELGNIPYTFFFAITEEEYNIAAKKEFYQQLLEQFSYNYTLSKINLITQDVIKYRPFLSDYIWSLFTAYNSFISRNAMLLADGIKTGNIQDWRKDDIMISILYKIDSSDRDRVLKVRTNAFGMATELLEKKILIEVSKVTSKY